jgi:hypothetical protein
MSNATQFIAREILAQLGGGRFIAMTGAKNLGSYENALSFKLPSNFATGGINYVKVTLTAMDDYAIEFGKLRGTTYKVIKTLEGVYNDNLRDAFESVTGLRTSL